MKNYAFKLAKVNSHVLFLEACLYLGLTPVGLTAKPPLSANPQHMWPELILLHKKMSIEATAITLKNYRLEQQNLLIGLTSVNELLLANFPDLVPEMVTTVTKANQLQENLAKTKLQKLSKLCLRKIKTEGFVEANMAPPTQKSGPLIGDKPSLASLFNLPIPTGQLPKLPKAPLKQPLKPEDENQNNTVTDPKEKISKPISDQSVMNISSHNLSQNEISVLSKGLTFTPNQRLDPFSLGQDIFSFARNLRIKYHLHQFPDTFKNQQQPEACLMKFKPPSNWDPPPLPPDHPLELYINYIMQSITNPDFLCKLPKEDNLTSAERAALKSLKSNGNIKVLPADKGSTTVVMDTTDYMTEAYRQLSDTSTYKKIEEDPTNKYNKELSDWLEQEAPHQNISIESLKLLINKNPSTPQFYILPKIHKDTLPPPGRPIVASCNSVTERISAFVDSHLQPIVSSLPSYVKDTNHFLDRLQSLPKPLPPGTILTTIDVTSLYTNIPHIHGLSAMEYFLDQRPKNSQPTTAFLLRLAKFILERNNFQFEGNNFLQVKGTAMGTRMAPSYANLFMGKLEQAFLKTQKVQPDCWFRFIDDIFLLWTAGIDSLNQFLQELNNFSTLKFTNNSSTSEIIFLDLKIQIQDGVIQTGVHFKPTNHLQYLHFDSNHPKNTKRSIPYSQAIRGKRICSTDKELDEFNDKITNAFIKRGYPKNMVQHQIRLAQSVNHCGPKVEKSNNVSLVTNYHQGLHTLNSILKDGFKILQASNHTKDFLKEPPTTVFRQPPNLKSILVHPKVPAPQYDNRPTEKLSPGSFPCNNKRCKTCEINQPSKTFTSSITKKTYQIHGHNTCATENIIYQLQCKQCESQYIGLSTNSLRTRMNGHRQDVSTQYKDKPVVQHALSHNSSKFNDCFTTKIVKSLPPHCNQSQLRRWELSYQWFTKSREAPNLNIR